MFSVVKFWSQKNLSTVKTVLCKRLKYEGIINHLNSLSLSSLDQLYSFQLVQGGPLGCSLGLVDFKTKAAFFYKDHILI